MYELTEWTHCTRQQSLTGFTESKYHLEIKKKTQLLFTWGRPWAGMHNAQAVSSGHPFGDLPWDSREASFFRSVKGSLQQVTFFHKMGLYRLKSAGYWTGMDLLWGRGGTEKKADQCLNFSEELIYKPSPCISLKILLELFALLNCDWVYVDFLSQQLDRCSAFLMEIFVVSLLLF